MVFIFTFKHTHFMLLVDGLTSSIRRLKAGLEHHSPRAALGAIKRNIASLAKVMSMATTSVSKLGQSPTAQGS